MEPIFVSWQPEHTKLWGNQPIRMAHRLHQHPLFSEDNLAALIERYPAGRYMLVRVGEQGKEKEWREGDFGGLSGADVMNSILHGRMWLNLLHVHTADPRFDQVLGSLFAEIEDRIPGCRTYNRICGLLVSSPEAQVYYHFDTSGQSLWQIAGRKRVYVYPPTVPFLNVQELERVCFYNDEVRIHYEPWYDNYAQVFEIGPGEMLAWPLNSPHRVENLGFSISMTVEYQTSAIHRKVLVNTANCFLRENFRVSPSERTSGPGYWGKIGMLGALKYSGVLEAKRRQRRPVTFRLDPTSPGRVIDVAGPA